MPITDFLLYLIYGFAMVTMGIFALLQRDSKIMNLPLIKSLKFLGLFGITHGISEWVSMIIRLELCHPHYYTGVYNFNLFLKAISFAFLMYFGLDSLPIRDRYKKIFLKAPIILLLIFVGGFTFLIYNYGTDYHILNTKFNIISIRYLMGFPSCIITAIALYMNARLIEKTKPVKISNRYKKLAWVFIVYGILEGLIIAQADFFPANIINREFFVEYLNIKPLFIKAFVGFVIYYLLIKVIDTFSWEQEEKLRQLEESRIAAKERRKLGLEIHDGIIQDLYAAGLKVEYLSANKDGDNRRDVLDEVREDLNNAIKKTREFISITTLGKIKLEDLKDNLEQLVEMFNQHQNIKINLKCEISPYSIDNLSPAKATQVYYIIQEAISNVIKHSEADYANVILEGRYDFLYITVIDNGKGIYLEDINPEKQFGINSMKERTKRVGGSLVIERINNGTEVKLKIPWEEQIDDE